MTRKNRLFEALPLRWAMLIAWAALAMPGAASHAQVAPASIPDGASNLLLKPCFLKGVPNRARCGTLAVPEDRAAGQGRMIELRVAVLPALEDPARPDPLFILAGGPGQSAVGIAAVIKRNLGGVNRHRDIVLVDQRGTGESGPLDCDLKLDEVGFDSTAKRAVVEDCLASLDADPRHYTTINHILDLEQVRTELGYQAINLYGGSYGTRVALVYLREHPMSVRAAIMDAVAPLDMRIGMEMGADAQMTLDEILARCTIDAACSEAFPEISQTLDDLLAGLAAKPLEIEYIDPASGEPDVTPMDHRIFALGLRALLYAPTTQRLVPVLIAEAAAGNFTPFIGMSLAANEGLLEVMTPALLMAVLCAEDLADLGPGDIPLRERESFVGDAQAGEFLGYCAAWPVPLQPVDFTPPRTDHPVLLLSGGLDPVTPPSRAAAALATLENGRHVVVPNGGHTISGLGCIPRLINEFLDSGSASELDDSCAAEIESPPFFVDLMGPKP